MSLNLRCLLGRHSRSPKARTVGPDGLYHSVCRRCGVRMVRERQTGRWLAFHHRDRRRQLRPLRRLGDRLTGPILFLLLLGLVFGLAAWLGGSRH